MGNIVLFKINDMKTMCVKNILILSMMILVINPMFALSVYGSENEEVRVACDSNAMMALGSMIDIVTRNEKALDDMLKPFRDFGFPVNQMRMARDLESLREANILLLEKYRILLEECKSPSGRINQHFFDELFLKTIQFTKESYFASKHIGELERVYAMNEAILDMVPYILDICKSLSIDNIDLSPKGIEALTHAYAIYANNHHKAYLFGLGFLMINFKHNDYVAAVDENAVAGRLTLNFINYLKSIEFVSFENRDPSSLWFEFLTMILSDSLVDFIDANFYDQKNVNDTVKAVFLQLDTKHVENLAMTMTRFKYDDDSSYVSGEIGTEFRNAIPLIAQTFELFAQQLNMDLLFSQINGY